jgi:tetratricopeptide (TPR) repeat protein
MFCLHCGTENSPDSKFCKECGSTVSEKKRTKVISSGKLSPHIAEDLGASEPINPQMKRLLDMAFWHNQTGNVPHAMLACEAALMIDSESTTALSLLGCLYEKQGDIQKAIDAFERVLEINPDSEADQDKLAALKRGEYIRPMLQPIKYRWLPPAMVEMAGKSKVFPAIAALVVTIVLFVVGILILRPHPADQIQAVNHFAYTAIPPSVMPVHAPITAPQQQPYAAPVQPADNTPTYAPNYGAQQRPVASQNYSQPYQYQRQSAQSTVPPVTDVADADPNAPSLQSVKPISPTPDELNNGVKVEQDGQLPQHTVVVGDVGADGGAASVTDQNTDQGGANQDAGPPPPAEQISIHVHGQGVSAVDAIPADSDDSLVSGDAVVAITRGSQLQSKALNYEQQGSYQAAERLYNKAITAYKQDIAGGQSVGEAQRGIAACRTGIQICQQSQ